MPTGDVRKTGKGAMSKGPEILPASSSLDSFENRMSGFCRALFKFGASNVSGFGRIPRGAVQTGPLLRELLGNCPEG